MGPEVTVGEPHLLDPAVETKGVEDMLAALSKEEAASMSDINMPLRHFRAEKVSFFFLVPFCMHKYTLSPIV